MNKLLKKVKDEDLKKKLNSIFKLHQSVLKDLKISTEKLLEENGLFIEKQTSRYAKEFSAEKLGIHLFNDEIYHSKEISLQVLKEMAKIQDYLNGKFGALSKEKLKFIKTLSI